MSVGAGGDTFLLSILEMTLAVFAAAVLGMAFVLRTGLADRLAVDVPNSRSSHVKPIPRVGGLVVIPAALCGWAVLPAVPSGAALPTVLLCAFSFVDDRRGLPVPARLGIHLLAAVLFLAMAQPTTDPLLLAVLGLGLVWLTNLYNFMDGIDGLAGGMALIGFGVLGIGALQTGGTAVASACLAVAAAAAGFLVFNWHPARLFLGDAGSIPLGFLAGALGILGWRDDLWSIWFPLLAFAPFVVDATVTLLRRLLRGDRVWQAHREHYYQRLVRMGWSHRRTALAEYAIMLGAGSLALLLRDAVPVAQFAGITAAAVVLAWLMMRVDARWRTFTIAGKCA